MDIWMEQTMGYPSPCYDYLTNCGAKTPEDKTHRRPILRALSRDAHVDPWLFDILEECSHTLELKYISAF